MFNFMKKGTEKEEKEKRKREKKERKDGKKRDRGSMSAEELLRIDEVKFTHKIHDILFFYLCIFLRKYLFTRGRIYYNVIHVDFSFYCVCTCESETYFMENLCRNKIFIIYH